MRRLTQIWKAKDVRNKLLFVVAMLVVYRIAAHIPIPGIDVPDLQAFFGSNAVLGLINAFTGGGYQNFSIVMLGVGPYITSSIIFQLLVMIVPKLEAIQKEGEAGQKKISQWTRMLTVPLAAVQAYGFIILLQRGGGHVGGSLLGTLTPFQWITAITVAVAGSIFLMWIGELITEKKVGNGISLMIFAGIIATLPQTIGNTAAVFDVGTQIFNLILFLLIALVTIVVIVIITEGQRNIPVTYARRVSGSQSVGGANTYLPLRVNQAGVIPIIFAISIILFPPMIAQFLQTSNNAFIADLATSTIALFANQTFYGIVYFLMVFVFTYFYTAVIFKPDQISENLQKQGGFIPGIRPGANTANYLSSVMNRIVLAGALFLGIVAVLPIIVGPITGITTFAVGGTSLLIIVAVVIESIKQIDAQLVMRDYE